MIRSRVFYNLLALFVYLAVLVVLGVLTAAKVSTHSLSAGFAGLVVGSVFVGVGVGATADLYRRLSSDRIVETTRRLSEEFAFSDMLRPVFYTTLGLALLHYGVFLIDNGAYAGLMTSDTNHLRVLHSTQVYAYLTMVGVGVVHYSPLAVAPELITLFAVVYYVLASWFVFSAMTAIFQDYAKMRRAAKLALPRVRAIR